MKRSLQEIVELLVFALIALLVGTGLLWLLGWVIGLVGALFKLVAGFIWLLLKYIIPIVIVAAAVFVLVRLARRQDGSREVETQRATAPTPPAEPPPPEPVPPVETPPQRADADPLEGENGLPGEGDDRPS